MKPHVFPPRRILLPTDLGGASSRALAFGRVLRDQFGAAVHVLHAQYFEMPPYFSSGQLDVLKRELERSRRLASEYLRKETDSLVGPGAEVIILEKPAVEAILETAAELDTDVIVMGTHGRRGAERMWLGSVAEQVMRTSNRPVMAVRESARPAPFRHLLCPVSFSDAGRVAFEYAVQIARTSRARLSVLHAVEPGAPPMDCPLVDEESRRLCEIEESVAHGSAARTILEAAQAHRPDLVVLGADRKPSLFGALFSSTTQRVMQASPAPVLVVPRV
jgi:nucleotide-binding universal stress UspA family protein